MGWGTRRRPAFVFGLLALSLFLSLQEEAEARRLALVIGNGAYVHLPPVGKAAADARSVAEGLRRLGFETVVGTDLDRRAFARIFNRFKRLLRRGDEVVFHFAGHGVTLNRRSYLLPVDITSIGRNAWKVAAASVDMEGALKGILHRQPRYVLGILNASHGAPFRMGYPMYGDDATVRRRGLVRLELPGAFILYAAGPSQTTLPDLGRGDSTPTSVFARVLLEQFEVPGLSVQEIARRTMTGVRDLARNVGHAQFPSYSDRMMDAVVLNPGPGKVAPQPREPRLAVYQVSGVAGTSQWFPLPVPTGAAGLLIVEGLPPESRLSAGRSTGAGRWTVPISRARGLSIRTRLGTEGTYEIAVFSEEAGGDRAQLATIRFVVRPSLIQRGPAARRGPGGAGPVVLGAGDVRKLIERGVTKFRNGSVSSARLLFNEIAEAGEPRGLLLSGMTYDPLEYDREELATLKPDPAKAMAFYRRARDAGVPEAADRISRLEAYLAGR